MTISRLLAAAALVAGIASTTSLALADPSGPAGIGRTETVRHDLAGTSQEFVQVRVDFAPDAAFPLHAHPGIEIAYVIEGTVEYVFDGKPPVTLKAGDSVYIPAGTVHSARNVGGTSASELATYLVEKGKPIVELAH